MTIFDILKADHQEVCQMMAEIQKTNEKQTENREKLFTEFKKKMEVHSRAEENAVYMLMEDKKKGRELVLESEEQHKLVDHLLRELMALGKDDENWGPKMAVLRQLIESHIEREEKELFKEMRKLCSAHELKTMAHDMEVLKRRFSMAIVGTLLRKIA